MSGALAQRLNQVGGVSRVRELRARVDELSPAVEEDAVLIRSLRHHVLELERTVMQRVAEAAADPREDD